MKSLQSSLFLLALQVLLVPASSGTFAQQPTVELPDDQTSTSPTAEKSAPRLNSKVVDVKKMVSFDLSLNDKRQPKLTFAGFTDDGIAKQANPIQFEDAAGISDQLVPEFRQSFEPKGVVIRVAQGVKYQMVNSLYSKVRKALTDNDISKPIYISVEEPQQKQEPDEIVTQEIVCRNKKASEIYDRVSRLAQKAFKLSVRLDPKRNSIIAKGPASGITKLEQLITYFDTGKLATEDNSQNPTEKSTEGSNRIPTEPQVNNPAMDRTAKSKAGQAGDASPQVQPGGNLQSPIAPSRPGNAIPELSKSGAVGRFQLAGIGNNLFLLDTATGDCWYLDANSSTMNWVKLPMPQVGR